MKSHYVDRFSTLDPIEIQLIFQLKFNFGSKLNSTDFSIEINFGSKLNPTDFSIEILMKTNQNWQLLKNTF